MSQFKCISYLRIQMGKNISILFSTTAYKALKMSLTIAFCIAAESWISSDEIFEENR